ncbi:MAG: 3-deoxy-D-manno-octulosonic acid transferase [Thermoguttaceae bacterium]
MPYLLNLIYLLLILLALPYLAWQAVFKGKYRHGFAAKLLGLVPRRTSDKTCIWFHAVSVGEVNLLKPLIRLIESKRTDWQCVVSTTTITGMELAKKKYPHLTVFYCPLDFTWAVAAAMRRIRPDLLVLAELELWPNLIRAARRHNARVAIINGRLGAKSFRGYSRIRPLIGGLLRRINVIAAQDECYAERFRQLGACPDAVHVSGSMKYDGARTDRDNPATRRLAALAGFGAKDVVWLAGSTQEPEEAIAIEIFRRLSTEFPRLHLVLVPRHPHRFDEVARLLDQSGMAWQRRTRLPDAPGATAGSSSSVENTVGQDGHRPKVGRGTRPFMSVEALTPRILLVDVVGELGAWWGTAQIAFVGGSFGRRGGQNMIEPAAYGTAVSFGPNTWNFGDVVAAMHAHSAAVEVADAEELEKFVRRCLSDPQFAAELGRNAKALVLSQLGATDRTFALLDALLRE